MFTFLIVAGVVAVVALVCFVVTTTRIAAPLKLATVQHIPHIKVKARKRRAK